jgi:beta-mannosidase
VHQWDGKSISNGDTALYHEHGANVLSILVWHQQVAYQKYKDLSGRFVSEFGMHGYPIMRTVDIFAPNKEDRFPQSKVIDCHNKGHGAETRIAKYLTENFRYSFELTDFTYASQILQSEAYGYAMRDWKRKFGGTGREECSGAIIWQVCSGRAGPSMVRIKLTRLSQLAE